MRTIPGIPRQLALTLLLSLAACAQQAHPILAIGHAVRKLAARLILVHLNDIQAVDGEVNVLLGTGISKIPAVMQELHRQNFAELVAVEYEKEGDANEDMRQDMEFACRLA